MEWNTHEVGHTWSGTYGGRDKYKVEHSRCGQIRIGTQVDHIRSGLCTEWTMYGVDHVQSEIHTEWNTYGVNQTRSGTHK